MHNIFFRTAFIALCLVLLSGTPTSATPLRARTATAVFDWDAITSLEQEPVLSRAQAVPARMTLSVRGVGRLEIIFDLSSRKPRTWPAYIQSASGNVIADPSQLVLIRATRRHKRGNRIRSARLAASIVSTGAENKTITLLLNAPARASGERRFLRVEVKRLGTRSKLRVANVPARVLESRSCGVSEHTTLLHNHSHHTNIRSSLPVQSLVTRRLELATDADLDLFQTSGWGADTNNKIALMVESANLIYERDLGITVFLAGQRLLNSTPQPLTSTEPTALLNEYRSYLNANGRGVAADNSHLFTGKPIDPSGTLGIAWIGAVCASPSYSHGITWRFNEAVDYLTFAHELGHNFNAPHDASLPPTIMYAYSSDNVQARFSTSSINTITTFVDGSGGSCLDDGVEITPTPTPSPSPTATATFTATPIASPTATRTATPAPPTATPTPLGAETVKRRITLTGTKVGSARILQAELQNILGVPIGGIQVRFQKINGRRISTIARRVTDAQGSSSYISNRAGRYRVVSKQPNGRAITSRTIRLK